MNLFLLILLLSPFLSSYSATDSEPPFALRTLPLFSNSLQLTPNLTRQCFEETSIFLESIREVAKISKNCLSFKDCKLPELGAIQDYVFAIEQLDAFGKLPPDLLNLNTLFEGSYDECRRVSGKRYSTTYSYLLSYIGENATCSGSHTHMFPRFGVCMPSSCTEDDLVEVFDQLISFPKTVCKAFRSEFKVQKTWSFWAVLGLLSMIVIISISATVVDFFRERQIGMSAVSEHAYCLRVFLSFSIWSNAELILSVKEYKSGYIRSLDCIRVLTVSWIIFVHIYSFKFPYNSVGKSMEFLEELSLSRQLILNFYFAIDTIFVLSGIVVAYLFFWNKPKHGNLVMPATWIHFYLHRYIRSVIPLIAFLGFFTVFSNYIQGPFIASEMNILTKEAKVCESNWWRNALYINNFAGDKNCYSASWILAVDTQLYLFCPIILITLFYSMTGGVLLIIGACLGSVFLEYLLFGIYELPAGFLGNGHHEHFYSVVYEMPWTRIPTFAIGLFVGYFLASFTKTRLKFHWTVPLGGWILSSAIAFWCIWGNYSYNSGNQWGIYQRATYFNFSKIGWAFFVSWVVMANHYGWGGPIANFMCHPIWQPFGRLSYCAFIVHRMVLYWFFNLGGTTPHAYSFVQMFLNYGLPGIALSYFAAFFLSLLFEVPVVKIEKIFFKPNIVQRRELSETVGRFRVRRGTVI